MRKFLATRKASSKVAAAGTGCFRHEITLLYFRAGGLPAVFGRDGCALAFPFSQAHSIRAPETNRAGKGIAESFPHPFRQARGFSSRQTKIFRHPFFVFLSLFLCFAFPFS